jgi:hypothetical protein
MAALPFDAPTHGEVVVQQSSKSERISLHPCIQQTDFECVATSSREVLIAKHIAVDAAACS